VKFLHFYFICLVGLSGVAQTPISWSYDINFTEEIIVLPALDLDEIEQQDAINDSDKSQPWRYGISRTLDIDATTQGEWTDIPQENGRIWRAGIKSTGALNISVNFDDFYLPVGARLQFYNSDGTDVSRIYSYEQNTPNNKLASWFVDGDLILIEYFEPYDLPGEATIKIGGIIHGYRMGKVTQFAENTRGLNDSGDCNYDVNCPTGDDFLSFKDVVKKSVAILTLGNGYLCTATMINNTAMDKTPYLLTANHCLQNSDPTYWTVRFNWMSPSPICASEDDSLDIQSNFTMSGAVLRANNDKSDFALVELFNEVPESWDISFAGWDWSGDLPNYQVGIHHPNGDIMKICRDNDGATKDVANGTEVWLIGGVSAGNGNGWEIGTTESGSSGSPLFDDRGKIIGQLYAGQAACNGTSTNSDYDVYGRFDVSWNDGTAQENRLRDWLDPIGSGQTSIESVQNALNVPENQVAGVLEIYPNPVSTTLTITNSRYPNLVYNLYNSYGQLLMGGSLASTNNLLHLETCAVGIYFLNLIDEDSNQQFTKKIVITK
jgi:hypothetical protein